jgi:hypothetical protein
MRFYQHVPERGYAPRSPVLQTGALLLSYLGIYEP